MRALCLLPVLLALLLPAAARAETRTGYLTMPDGVQLKYTAITPTAGGRAPVLVTYDGHFAGNDVAQDGITSDALKAGYAVVGVNARGTGCSSGQLVSFTRNLGQDGARIVEWAAAQDFSNGRVGMFGFSFAGILQLMTAAERPPHLMAIAPGSPIVDLYRDVARPGGILNTGFTSFYDGSIKGETASTDVSHGTDCAAMAAGHEDPAGSTNLTAFASSNSDEPAYTARDPGALASQIDVPVLLTRSWQDPVVGSRIDGLLDRLPAATTYTVETNGHHGLPIGTARFGRTLIPFFDRYVKGDTTAFANQPHSEVWHETSPSGEPSWITTTAARPVPVPLRLYLRTGGRIALDPPLVDGSDSYAGGAQSPSVNATAGDWEGSAPTSGGTLAYTTPPLSADVSQYGSASLDLWVASSQSDADLQATVTQVRPDGQETYLQRGWLKLSRRALASSSTVLQPVQTERDADAAALTPGVPVSARMEILPFGHVFRAGSSLRVWIESPTGATGQWRFPTSAAQPTVTILHDATHPSSLVLGTTGELATVRAFPACGNVELEPCRPNPMAAPAGTLPVPLSPAPAPAGTPPPAKQAPAPAAPACKRTRRVRLALHPRRGHPIVHVRVASPTRALRTRRGKALRSVTFTAPAKRVRLRITTRERRGRLRVTHRTLAALKTACR